MTAFLELLNTYAIFFYIAGVIVVLFGIKMLFDARRAGRTTLFTLEQEQASDRAFRALVVMLGATLFIAAVAGINAFVSPVVPTTPSDVIEPTDIPFTPPVMLPTATSLPTFTVPPPSPAATQAAQATAGPTAPAQATAATAPTQVTEPPTAVPQPTSALIYLAPPLNIPPNGDSIGGARIQIGWGLDEFGGLVTPAMLPIDQWYRLAIRFTDRTQNAPVTLVLCTHESIVDNRTGVNVAEYRTEAIDNLFQWNVTIVQAASQQACEAGDFAPLSPPSATFSFKLP